MIPTNFFSKNTEIKMMKFNPDSDPQDPKGINPDKISTCITQQTAINPDEEQLEPIKDNSFLTFEEIRANRQTAQSKYLQSQYFKSVFGDEKRK